MESKELIFDLIMAAKEQQETAEHAISELSAIIDSVKTYNQRMSSSHAYLTECVGSMKGSVADVKKLFDKSIEEFCKEILEASTEAALRSSAEVSKKAAESLVSSFAPLLGTVEKASHRAESAVEKLNKSASYLSAKSLAFFVACAVSVVGISFSFTAWERQNYKNLELENERLTASNKELITKGALINFSTCGNENRRCVEVWSENQTVYSNPNRSRFWIVPKGY